MKKLILLLLLLPILATSQNEWLIGKTIENSRTYKARWLPDLGALRSDNISKAFYAMSKQNGIADNIQFAWIGEAATKTRVSGIYNFATKLYSTVGTNDGTQTTELNQPYISGNIAPTEKYALRNPNGDDNYIVFPTQTLTGSWSISMSINWNGSSNSIASILGNNSATLSNIMLKNTDNKFSFQNQAGTTVSGSIGLTNKLVGKNKIIHLAASGASLAIYVDGVLAETLTVNTDITLSRLMKGSATASREYFGDIKSLCIRTGAITATQVTSEYNFFRSIYPEVETTKIGNQNWATSNLDVVATPQGNLISNVTDNTAWDASTTTYDNTYAATSGTVEQKTYAAVKAAAMWCYYNNDAALGAIYGKLYNWYAAKLLQLDIDYYNAANPSTPWGYRVPTSTDFTTLQTTLGGSAVAGGKMKKEGTVYFASPNTGADNSSGFSALGVGNRRFGTGAFENFGIYNRFWTITSAGSTSTFTVLSYNNNTFLVSVGGYNQSGQPIRLIKN